MVKTADLQTEQTGSAGLPVVALAKPGVPPAPPEKKAGDMKSPAVSF
jgi:hypothetical protein